MKKLLSIEGVVALLFVVLLALPLIVSIVQEDQKISSSEKRKLAEFPELRWSSENLETFPKDFETYYDDHFGFRSTIVRLHNYLLLKVFRVSPTPLVVVGSDNWYFFNADSSIADFIGRFHYSDIHLKRFHKLLEDRQKWLESIGSRYIFMPVPNKETVYAEHLPLRIRNHRAATKYDQIVDYLKQQGFTGLLDTQEILLDQKKIERVFLQTDSHWNHDGTNRVYRELIARLQQWFPDIQPLRQKEQKEWFEDFSGDLSILMNLRGLITEVAPKSSIIEECDPIPGKVMHNLRKDPYYASMEAHRLPVFTGCRERTYKAVVIHDSFGKYLRPYLNQHFKRVIYINYMNFENARRLIEKEKPDVVIDQRAARNIQRALRPDPELEELLLAELFNTDLPEVFSIEDEQWHDRLLESPGVQVANSANSITAEFKQNKASISLQLDLSGQAMESAGVKVSLDSEQDSVLAFCYEPDGGAVRDESLCTRRDLTRGSSDVLFRILEPGDRGTLTVIAQKPGTITFKKLSVKPEETAAP